MFMKQYVHRLPADYDMSRIRERAGGLAAAWDQVKGLGFKAFMVQERGANAARGNAYSSLYLWLDDEAAVDFIIGDRFRSVIDAFGRPRIATWLPLDMHLGRAAGVLSLYREDIVLDESADLAAIRTAEAARNMKLVREADTFAAITAVDVSTWRLSRFRLSAGAVHTPETGSAYEILHLARPGLPALPAAA